MATVTGLTKEAMEAIRDGVIVDAEVVGNNLILTKFDATTIDAGNVRGPVGPASPAKVTALPGSPTDEDAVVLQTSAMAALSPAISWHVKYENTSSKWEFLGGPQLYSGGGTLNVAPGGDGVWTELSTTQASLTIPVAGIYDVSFGASLQEDIGGSPSGDIFVSLYKNGASVTNQNEAWDRLTTAYAKTSIRNVARLTFAANDVIRTRGAVSSGSWNNYRWKSAFVTAVPVRLG